MTKEVLITTRGMQFSVSPDESDSGDIEIVTLATYYEKGNSHYLIYDEMLEGVDTPVSNRVKYTSDYLEVNKKGDINVHMVFEPGKQNLTNYHTPFGDIIIGITTKKIFIDETDDHIYIQVDYSLDVNYEFFSDCTINMTVTPRQIDA